MRRGSTRAGLRSKIWSTWTLEIAPQVGKFVHFFRRTAFRVHVWQTDDHVLNYNKGIFFYL